MTADRAPDVARLVTELATVTRRARRSFGDLRGVQLNWKPGREAWSIAQCLEHLILVNAPYLPIFDAIARGEWRPRLSERLPVLPRLFGRLVLKTVQPDSGRRVKARPRFEPPDSVIEDTIVERFAAHQAELLRLMQDAASRDLARTIITSPVARFVTYSALDACRIIVAHEQQHVAQAERVLTALRTSAWR